MDNRITIINCTNEKFHRFISAAQKQSKVTNHKPANSASPQERYTLIYNGERVSIVWETKSQKVVLTADNGVAEKFKSIYQDAVVNVQSNKNLPEKRDNLLPKAVNKSETNLKQVNEGRSGGDATLDKKSKIKTKETTKSDKGTKERLNNTHSYTVTTDDNVKNTKKLTKRQKNSQKSLEQGKSEANSQKIEARNQADASANLTKKMSQAFDKAYTPLDYPYPSKTPVATKQSDAKKTKKVTNIEEKTNISKSRNPSAPQKRLLSVDDILMEEAVALGLYKDDDVIGIEKKSIKKAQVKPKGYTKVKFSKERFEAFIKKQRADKKIRVKVVSDIDGILELKLQKGKKSVAIKYNKTKKQLNLESLDEDFFNELKAQIELENDYKTAVSSYIKLIGEEKKAGEIQRELKRKLPSAFEYLSEQSKIDLAIGLIDIMNDEVRLSDYSMLLVPPYRGLERFIYDLQMAKGIEVKMIGQAFEKDDEGRYKIKVGYQRRIKSVIYNEVLSALYTEYFNKRNFYAHSDNSLSSSNRIISDKGQVKQIYLRLLEMIDYNSKKLKETGFCIR